jgi:hypothetical protein
MCSSCSNEYENSTPRLGKSPKPRHAKTRDVASALESRATSDESGSTGYTVTKL